eukprot:gene18050-21549_t
MQESSPFIDTHVHIWSVTSDYSPEYSWLTPDLKQLYRDVSLDDYKLVSEKSSAVGAVLLVQAAPCEAETIRLLEVAQNSAGYVKGVVGWVDMLAGADAIAKIESLRNTYKSPSGKPLLVGLRPMLQDLPEEDWMMKMELKPVINHMVSKKMVFDALVKPNHLKHLRKFLVRYPNLRVVIDHAAKPSIAGDQSAFQAWKADIEWIAKNNQTTMVKVSGLYPQVELPSSVERDAPELNGRVAPYIMHLVRCFTPKRLIWGSDYPVSQDYEFWLRFCRDCFSTLSKDQQNDFFFKNAISTYNL